jgi:signal transduction histidine kinase
MKAVETDLDGSPEAVRPRLHYARQMLRHSRALARNAIRELRSESVPGRSEGLLDGFRRVTDSWNHSGALQVELQISGRSRPLEPGVEHHLLGIGTEAITNAVKHGHPTNIRVCLAFQASEIVLSVTDDGGGFEPRRELAQSSGRFGLIGMQERVRELGGTLRIESQPAAGASVVVTVPIPPDPPSPDPPLEPLRSPPVSATP